jgi:hypothetical protein
MKLMTKAQERKMTRNFEKRGTTAASKPVIKLFTPWGNATWYLSEYDAENDLFFGLCDLGMGFPEMGYVSKSDLEGLRGPWGLKVERDMYTSLNKTYTEIMAGDTP